MAATLVMQQIAYNVDDVKCLSPVLSPPIVMYLTRSQGGNCERALENGNLLQIRPQTTISHAVSNTRDPRSGSVTVISLRDGKKLAPCCGSTGYVCSYYR